MTIKYPTQVEMVESYMDYCEGVVEVINIDLPDYMVEILVEAAARCNMGVGRYLNKMLLEKCDEIINGHL